MPLDLALQRISGLAYSEPLDPCVWHNDKGDTDVLHLALLAVQNVSLSGNVM